LPHPVREVESRGLRSAGVDQRGGVHSNEAPADRGIQGRSKDDARIPATSDGHALHFECGQPRRKDIQS